MIKPLKNRVVLKEVENATETASGILLPVSQHDNQNIALVVAKGDDASELISIGDRVVYDRYKGSTVEIDDTKHIIIDDNHILAIIQ